MKIIIEAEYNHGGENTIIDDAKAFKITADGFIDIDTFRGFRHRFDLNNVDSITGEPR